MTTLAAEWKAKHIVAKCAACSGTGYYDVKGSPKCSSCGGTGLSSK